MSIVTDSINNAIKIEQIGFPEFTTKLVTDVFNAVVSSNITQTEAYIEMMNSVNKSVEKYILDTKDDISGTEILNFLVKTLPDITSEAGTKIFWNNPNYLNNEEVSILNSALVVEGLDINDNIVNSEETIKSQYNSILEAVAAKIASKKYVVLQELVKLGLSRLVVRSGEIETKLNFQTLELPFYREAGISYATESDLSNVDTRSIVSSWLNYSTANRYARVGVSTITETPRNANGISIQVAGAIKLNFGAEYKSINQK